MNRRAFIKKAFKVSGVVVATSAASELLNKPEVKRVESFDLTTISIVPEGDYPPVEPVQTYKIKRSDERNIWFSPIKDKDRKPKLKEYKCINV